jgi:hypothetical protein
MKRILVVALSLALAGAAMASQAEVYTVGDFAVNLAKMVTNKADYTPEQAAAYLKEVGVDLGDLDAQVDEEIFVGAFNGLGVNMVTASPDSEVSGDKADRVFQLFDANNSLFTGELYRTCLQETVPGKPNVRQCITDADCLAGHECKIVKSIKCEGGSSHGDLCMGDGDCPDGHCNIPPGQLKRLDIASPSD